MSDTALTTLGMEGFIINHSFMEVFVNFVYDMCLYVIKSKPDIGGTIRDAKGQKVSGNFGNFPWKVSGILKEWEFLEILGIFNFDLVSRF